MRPEDIRELLTARPFRPLRLYLSDGSSYDITHPDLVLVTRSFVEVGIAAEPASGIAERIARCSLLHIVKTEHEAA